MYAVVASSGSSRSARAAIALVAAAISSAVRNHPRGEDRAPGRRQDPGMTRKVEGADAPEASVLG
jgi:hypothetical protein